MNESRESAGNSESASKLKVLIAVVIALVVLVAFFAFSRGGDNPKPWLDENYSRVSGSDPDHETVVYRSDESKMTTYSRIVQGTDPDDRFESDYSAESAETAAYLRYDADWIVTVRADGDDGARITLDEYDRAYSQHSTFLPVVWGSFHGRSSGGGFRGGGGGFGK